MKPGDEVAAAAHALVGTPFRLHGRHAETGIDCIGLALLALRGAGLEAVAPAGYRLRNSSIDDALNALENCDLEPTHGAVAPGDILLASPGPAQHHVIVAGARGSFIHAHAGLRRVVIMPGPLTWPIRHHWRPIRKDL